MQEEYTQITSSELAILQSESEALDSFLISGVIALGGFSLLSIPLKLTAGLSYLLACWLFSLSYLLIYLYKASEKSRELKKGQGRSFWLNTVFRLVTVFLLGLTAPLIAPVIVILAIPVIGVSLAMTLVFYPVIWLFECYDRKEREKWLKILGNNNNEQ